MLRLSQLQPLLAAEEAAAGGPLALLRAEVQRLQELAAPVLQEAAPAMAAAGARFDAAQTAVWRQAGRALAAGAQGPPQPVAEESVLDGRDRDVAAVAAEQASADVRQRLVPLQEEVQRLLRTLPPPAPASPPPPLTAAVEADAEGAEDEVERCGAAAAAVGQGVHVWLAARERTARLQAELRQTGGAGGGAGTCSERRWAAATAAAASRLAPLWAGAEAEERAAAQQLSRRLADAERLLPGAAAARAAAAQQLRPEVEGVRRQALAARQAAAALEERLQLFFAAQQVSPTE